MPRSRPPVLAQLNFQKHKNVLTALNLGERFEEIYRRNVWGSPESVSGLGSTLDATHAIREGLIRVCHEFHIKTLLDAPCGDYGWMSTLDLPLSKYIGADIVSPLVERNRDLHGNEKVEFLVADITRDPLPRADAILCRDCLVHLSFANITRALRNFSESGSTYLLTTTFPEHRGNTDIEDGDWRLLNFQEPPFDYPEPLRLINEQCTEMEGAYDDKSLALWRFGDLPF